MKNNNNLNLSKMLIIPNNYYCFFFTYAQDKKEEPVFAGTSNSVKSFHTYPQSLQSLYGKEV